VINTNTGYQRYLHPDDAGMDADSADSFCWCIHTSTGYQHYLHLPLSPTCNIIPAIFTDSVVWKAEMA